MTTKYRSDAMLPQDIRLAFVYGSALDQFAILLTAAGQEMSYAEYQLWLKHWKSAYEGVSADIKHFKKAGDLAQVATLRRMANTLLNARQYNRDLYVARKGADVE